MFANAFQSGFISVFYSVGSNPLSLWDKSVKNGHIRRVVDDEVKSLVLELSGTNVATTYITCPIKARASLGIKLPFLVMIIKNMKKYFTFEIQIADDKDMRRRFRISNFQSTTKVRPFCTTMPIGLSPGWNQIQFNLADFTKRAYGSTYLETVRVQIHANARIRRIYFSDRLYGDNEMPNEFRLFLPTPGTHRKPPDARKGSKDAERKSSKDIAASADKMSFTEEVPSVAPPATPAEESPKVEPVPSLPEDEEALVEETAVVDVVAEDVSAEAPPEESKEASSAVEGPAEEETATTGGDEAASETPSEAAAEPPAEEPPAEEHPAEEPLAEGPTAEGPPSEELPAEEQPPE